MPKIPTAETLPVRRGKEILAGLTDDFAALGIVGEPNLLTALYLIGTSRLLNDPVSGVVQGTSSSGKSAMVIKVSKLFPDEQVINATSVTDAVLFRMGSLKHKFVVKGERSRVQDDTAADATRLWRELVSDKFISKHMCERNAQGAWESVEYVQEGPIAYVETTTLKPGKIFGEDLNRCLLLQTDDSESQTRAVMMTIAQQRTGLGQKVDPEKVIEKHRAFQAALTQEAIAIPFAVRLMEALPAGKTEMRRAATQILAMIEAATLLQQADRQRDSEGRLVATTEDYEIAARVLAQPLTSKLDVSSKAQEFYDKLVQKFGTRQFSATEVYKLDKASDDSIRRWLGELADTGCLVRTKEGGGRGNPSEYRLTDRTPTDAILPTAAELTEA